MKHHKTVYTTSPLLMSYLTFVTLNQGTVGYNNIQFSFKFHTKSLSLWNRDGASKPSFHPLQ